MISESSDNVLLSKIAVGRRIALCSGSDDYVSSEGSGMGPW